MTKFLYTYGEYVLKSGDNYLSIPDPSFVSIPQYWPYPPDENTKTFNITSSPDNSWDVSTNPAWVQIKSKTGQSGGVGTIETSVGYNNTGNTRIGQIVIKPRFMPEGYIIDVSQGVVDSVSIDPTSLVFEADGSPVDDDKITITSSGTWTTTLKDTGDGTGWILSLDPSSGGNGDICTVYVDYNSEIDARSCNIIFTVGTATTEAIIQQYGYI